MRTLARIAVTVLAGGALATTAALPAHANQAATAQAYNHCNGKMSYNKPGRSAAVPVFYYGFSPVIDCVLGVGRGGGGGSIEALQASLKYCNNAPTMVINGVYTQHVVDVITWIQAASGVKADGVYGPVTRGLLRWAFYNELSGKRTCEHL
ncbi:hypothetical protein ACIBG8_08230 [Nonomuraea sp. NPDC050556]|uniref:hypothetical protein n=1 Tax=Nonomuraea sp. NPDC050556 TaxID=3364369 RepID=UPI0037986B35